jgi:hypothetical protein
VRLPNLSNNTQISTMIFWVVTTCATEGRIVSILKVKMEKIRSSEMLVTTYKTTGRHKPEDVHRHLQDCQNLKYQCLDTGCLLHETHRGMMFPYLNLSLLSSFPVSHSYFYLLPSFLPYSFPILSMYVPSVPATVYLFLFNVLLRVEY